MNSGCYLQIRKFVFFPQSFDYISYKLHKDGKINKLSCTYYPSLTIINSSPILFHPYALPSFPTGVFWTKFIYWVRHSILYSFQNINRIIPYILPSKFTHDPHHNGYINLVYPVDCFFLGSLTWQLFHKNIHFALNSHFVGVNQLKHDTYFLI